MELQVPLAEAFVAHHNQNNAASDNTFIGDDTRIRGWLQNVALAHLPPKVSQPPANPLTPCGFPPSSGNVAPRKTPGVTLANEPNVQPLTEDTDQLPVRRSARIRSKSRVKGLNSQTRDMDAIEAASGEQAHPIGEQFTIGRRSQRLMKRQQRSEKPKKDIRNEAAEDVSSSGAPRKRRKTQEDAQVSRTGGPNQHIDRDLLAVPAGNDMSRHVFISACVRFPAAHQGPWITDIPTTQFRSAAQTMHNAVYPYIQHKVVVGGRIYYVSQQNLSDSRAAFAAVAIAAITDILVTSQSNTVPAARVAYARMMLQSHRFLFRKNTAPQKSAWSGLWRAPAILQTFVCHLNLIEGCMETNPRAALALSCAAVCRALTLVANENIAFGPTPDGWFVTVQIGIQFEFNEDLWGTMTRRFLQPIMSLADEQFALIVEETQVYAVNAQRTTMNILEPEVDEEFLNLYEFR